MNAQYFSLKAAVKDCIPIVASYIVLGIAFGVLLKDAGYGIIYAVLMSTFIYGGTMQFVAISLLTTHAAFLTTAITSFMVSARQFLYSISVIDQYKGAGKLKPYIIHALTDETYTLVTNNKDKDARYFFSVSLINHLAWILGGVLGNLLGEVLPFNTQGMDFALTALFLTFFIDQWKSSHYHFPALLGVFASLFCLVIFGPNHFLIPTMIIMVIGLLFAKQKAGL